jgi:Flp pilus assembly protein TadG
VVENGGMRQAANTSERTETESGQALAEATIVLVLVLLLLGGLVEFGWAYFRYLSMQNAAGEGAAYGMMYSTWHQGADPTAPYYNVDPNNIVYRVRNESTSPILDWSAATVDVELPAISPNPENPGNPVVVTVTFEHRLITPILSQLVSDGTITLRARAVQTILAPPP